MTTRTCDTLAFMSLEDDPHALPRHPSSLDPVGQSHWLIILAAETHYRLFQPQVEAKYNENLIGVRVYGCLLLDCAEHASTPYRFLCNELANIRQASASESAPDASEINLECFQEIAARGIYYQNLLLRVFHPNIPYAAESAIDTHSEESKSMLQKATLARDGHKCVVSGTFDSDTFDSLTFDEQDRLLALGVGKLAYLEVARIFPQPECDVGSGKEEEEDLGASPRMSLFKLFGVDEPPAMETLDGLSNVMMMTPDLHKAFARLDFWLEDSEAHGWLRSVDAPLGSCLRVSEMESLLAAAKKIVFDARRADKLHLLTPKNIRHQLETQLELAEGTLNGPEYKQALRTAIDEATHEPLPKADVASTSASKKRKTPDEDGDEDEDEEEAPKPKPPRKRASSAKKQRVDDGSEAEAEAEEEVASKKTKANAKAKPAKKPRLSGSGSDDEAEAATAKPKAKSKPRRSKSAPSKKDFKSSETVQSSDVEGMDDEDDKVEEGSSKPEKKPAKAKSDSDIEDAPTKKPKKKKEVESDSELSMLEDEPAKKKSKKKTTTEKKSKAGNSDDPQEAQIKKLKAMVVACGVRKTWSKVFADLDKPSQQIKKLKEILAELGMKGQPSLAKARALREQRELAQELEDVQTFAAARGMKSQASAKKPEEEKEENDEDDDDGDIVVRQKRPTARQAVMSFLEDQSSDDD
uniref:Uncharacterized protein n=1 Tax=Mycena chlorophos TaxID=658473 RepID=A0ABQ0LHK8_MYCCL|nr:predicted protein [Mycena chlorophos]